MCTCLRIACTTLHTCIDLCGLCAGVCARAHVRAYVPTCVRSPTVRNVMHAGNIGSVYIYLSRKTGCPLSKCHKTISEIDLATSLRLFNCILRD